MENGAIASSSPMTSAGDVFVHSTAWNGRVEDLTEDSAYIRGRPDKKGNAPGVDLVISS